MPLIPPFVHQFIQPFHTYWRWRQSCKGTVRQRARAQAVRHPVRGTCLARGLVDTGGGARDQTRTLSLEPLPSLQPYLYPLGRASPSGRLRTRSNVSRPWWMGTDPRPSGPGSWTETSWFWWVLVPGTSWSLPRGPRDTGQGAGCARQNKLSR